MRTTLLNLAILALALTGCEPPLESAACVELAPYHRVRYPAGFQPSDFALEAQAQALLLLMSHAALPFPSRGGPPATVEGIAPVTHLDGFTLRPVIFYSNRRPEAEALMRRLRQVSDRIVEVDLFSEGYEPPGTTEVYWVLLSETTESTVEVNVGRYPKDGTPEGFLFQFVREGDVPILKSIANYPADWTAASAR